MGAKKLRGKIIDGKIMVRIANERWGIASTGSILMDAVAEKSRIMRKCQVIGAIAGASLPLGAFVVAQLGGTAPLTLRIALVVFYPILWMLGGIDAPWERQTPMRPVNEGLMMFGGLGFYLVLGWFIGVILGCYLCHRKFTSTKRNASSASQPDFPIH
jgi:hypothetical protein